jgi:hypothetical protein
VPTVFRLLNPPGRRKLSGRVSVSTLYSKRARRTSAGDADFGEEDADDDE